MGYFVKKGYVLHVRNGHVQNEPTESRMRRIPYSICLFLGAAALCAVIGNSLAGLSKGDYGSEAAFLEWQRQRKTTSIRSDLEEGLALLHSDPNQVRFYPSLSLMCEEMNLERFCYDRFKRIRSVADESMLSFVDYALGRLSFSADSARSSAHTLRASLSPELSPRLARLIVDDAFQGKGRVPVETLSTRWSSISTKIPSATGPKFGLAYILITKEQWNRAESALRELARSSPNEPDIFRELGRIYFHIGRRQACIESFEYAVSAAIVSRDLEAELIARGNLAYLKMRWEGATESTKTRLHEVIRLANHLGDLRAVGVNSYRIGELEARRARYDDALSYLARAEELASFIPISIRVQALATRGEIFRRLNRFDEATKDLEAAFRIARLRSLDIDALTVTLYAIQLYRSMGKTYLAETKSIESIRISDSLKLADSRISFRTVLGDLLSDRSDFSYSIDIYKEALEIAEHSGYRWRIIELVIKLGRSYACIGNSSQAERFFRLAIDNAIDGSDSTAIGTAHHGMASVYLSLGNYSLADSHISRSLIHLEDKDIPWIKFSLYRMLSIIRYETADAHSSDIYLHKAYEYADNSWSKLQISCDLGYVAYRRGNFIESLEHYSRAENYNHTSDIIPQSWRIYLGQALTLWMLGRHSEAEVKFLKASAEVERTRGRLDSALERSLVAAHNFDLYDSYATFLDEQQRYESAVNAIERGRSRTLVDLLYTTQMARGAHEGSQAERAIDARTRSRALVSEHTDVPLSSADDGSRALGRQPVSAEALGLEALFRRLEKGLVGSEPLYAYRPITVTEAQEVIASYEAIILYSLRADTVGGRVGSSVYLVTRDSVAYVPLDVNGTDLEESIRFFRDAITDSESGPGSRWAPAAKRLHRLLVKPLLPLLGSQTTHLHFIPDGPLHYLPFAALMDNSGRYLVEQFDMSVAPSLTVLKLSRDRNPMTWDRMLLIADPDNDLPGARFEANQIAAGAPLHRRLIVGADATQDQLSREAPHFDILHLATHGEFVPRNPLASHLKLRGDNLTVDEIGELDLNAYLVTLSGCETALSGGLLQDHAPGEEWIGLYQSFLAAGTPTVLASLWNVYDRHSGPLMSRFYERLRSNGKARALAEVQRDFIANAHLNHPFFWAGFTVIGDPR